MDEKLKEFITAIGSMAEMSGIMRDELIRCGFTRKEACEIIGVFLQGIFHQGK